MLIDAKRQPTMEMTKENEDLLWKKALGKSCFGDPNKYLHTSCRAVCNKETREACFEACYIAVLRKEEEFRQKHGHDRRFATVRYNEDKGRKGWGKTHERYKGK